MPETLACLADWLCISNSDSLRNARSFPGKRTISQKTQSRNCCGWNCSELRMCQNHLLTLAYERHDVKVGALIGLSDALPRTEVRQLWGSEET